MEEIKNLLVDIIKEQLQNCKDKKEVPSSDVLDTIKTYTFLYQL